MDGSYNRCNEHHESGQCMPLCTPQQIQRPERPVRIYSSQARGKHTDIDIQRVRVQLTHRLISTWQLRLCVTNDCTCKMDAIKCNQVHNQVQSIQSSAIMCNQVQTHAQSCDMRCGGIKRAPHACAPHIRIPAFTSTHSHSHSHLLAEHSRAAATPSVRRTYPL